MGLSTIFFPVHRVERINKDETVGRVPSLADVFAERVGKDVWSYLGLGAPLPEGDASRLGSGSDARGSASGSGRRSGSVSGSGSEEEWMTLREAERDYLERVLSDCEWDRELAARVLDVSLDELESRIQEHDLDVEAATEVGADLGSDPDGD